MIRAGARLILGLLVLIGPVVGFWLERLRVGANAERAIGGLAWGVLASVLAAVGLALVARGSAMARFMWFALSLTAALIIWLLTLGLPTLIAG